MTHFYTAKKYNRWSSDREQEVRLLCTKEYVVYDRYVKNAVTSASNVSCPACLDILIPLERAKLSKMEATRAKFVQADPELTAVSAKYFPEGGPVTVDDSTACTVCGIVRYHHRCSDHAFSIQPTQQKAAAV